jgi:hypothetical protein
LRFMMHEKPDLVNDRIILLSLTACVPTFR